MQQELNKEFERGQIVQSSFTHEGSTDKAKPFVGTPSGHFCPMLQYLPHALTKRQLSYEQDPPRQQLHLQRNQQQQQQCEERQLHR